MGLLKLGCGRQLYDGTDGFQAGGGFSNDLREILSYEEVLKHKYSLILESSVYVSNVLY